jgi:hypothetical protein
MIHEELYLGDYSSKEELEEAMGWYWSGSRMDAYGTCWRRGQHRYDDNLERIGATPHPFIAGGALHAGLAFYYALGGRASEVPDMEEQCIKLLRDEITIRGGFPEVPTDHQYAHLTPGHLEIILKYYFPWAKKHDSVKPLIVRMDQLNMENVVGAKLRYTADERVVLGESSFVMRLKVKVPWSDKPVYYIYAGIPDVPVEMSSSHYIMDHKSTGYNLSSWYFSKWRVDNTLRVYCWMTRDLLKKLEIPLHGFLINGITFQKPAAKYDWKGTRFLRYGPIDFEPSQLHEAMINHAATIQMREFIQEELGGYYKQDTGQDCRRCPMAELCHTPPVVRMASVATEYQKREQGHLLQIRE